METPVHMKDLLVSSEPRGKEGFWVGMVWVHKVPLLRLTVLAGSRGFGREEMRFGEVNLRRTTV